MASFLAKAQDAIKVKKGEGGGDAKKYGKWSNVDLEPTPPEQRNWSPLYYFAFQFSIAFSPTTYNIGSTLFSIGLNYWLVIIAAFLGTFMCCLVLYFNSRGPLFYHIG